MTSGRSTMGPCVAKVARTVLKTSGGSDPLAEFNRAIRPGGLWRRMMQATYKEKGDRWKDLTL
jgi:hypothetical protein